jgi:ectonucleotide pyrophosphatase/phosphodiesterase family protein 1/3
MFKKTKFKICDYVLKLFIVLKIFLHLTKYVNSSKLSSLLLISFGGFRWDYLNIYNDLSNFNNLKSVSSYAEYISSVFPSQSATNQWSMVTGLYPYSHGIINNEIYDPVSKSKVNLFKSNQKSYSKLLFNNDEHFSEPIWITNQKAGQNRQSVARWLGADVKFANLSVNHYVEYDSNKSPQQLIDEFLSLFNSGSNFAALYFDEPGKKKTNKL